MERVREVAAAPTPSLRWSPADVCTALRIPLAALFILVPDAAWRLVILAAAALSDYADGLLARRFGASRLGAFLDPVADKVFMVAAFGVVLASGALTILETLGVLARDITAAVAFLVTVALRRPASIPARFVGKAVTVGQLLTLGAFLLGMDLLRPLAWVTASIALYAIVDYSLAASAQKRDL